MSNHIVPKNYKADEGNTWVIGGKLVLEEDGKLDGFPRVENLAADATVATLIAAMKAAKVMVGDSFTLDVASCTPTIAETAANSTAATVTYEDGVITVSVEKVSELADSDHGSYWGTHKWIGFGVSTGLDSVVDLVFNDHFAKVKLTADDVAEAQNVGLNSNGQFVLYIKAEEVLEAGGKSFVLSYPGKEDTEVLIKVVETAEDEGA